MSHFDQFRKHIIGIDTSIQTPYHEQIPMIYADWTASGRMYDIIEEKFIKDIYPLVANTHTDTSQSGMTMTYAYHKAREVIKQHVHANKNDVLIASNSGMTGVINKFQRILGLKIHESFKPFFSKTDLERPVIFITHMEHHSNQTSWNETLADVVIIPPNEEGLVCLENFKAQIETYKHRTIKIASITSCSNVTGIFTPYMDIAELIHQYDGYCFVDFACSAPYVNINMHESDATGRYLDAIYFSPHKFLGGPGSPGILIFNSMLYHNLIPDNPGGGTVEWTNPWGEQKYTDDIESREDGGTPAFLQTIRAAMCVQLKTEMGVKNIQKREKEILNQIWETLDQLPNLHVLADQHRDRLGVVSFYIDQLHYNVGVRILNDRFGIQTKGGCSCAGTYGHYLLNVTKEYSDEITSMISSGDCSLKPGWIRLSIHPTHTDKEIQYICNAITALAKNHVEWSTDYEIDIKNGAVQPKEKGTTRIMEQKINACLTTNFI